MLGEEIIMAYTSGTTGVAAGNLIAILDAELVLNDKWSIHDAATGANAKVYKCLDAGSNVEFYVYVGNNDSGFGVIELWEDWDEVGHAGVGDSLTLINGSPMRINLVASGGYGLCVSDHRFIFLDLNGYKGYYCGQTNRFYASKNMPIWIGNNNGNSNALGYRNATNHGQWAALYDEVAGVGETLNPFLHSVTFQYRKTIAGSYWVQELPVYVSSTAKHLGILDGVGGYGYTEDNGLNNGDIITISGVEWIALGGPNEDSWVFVRKS